MRTVVIAGTTVITPQLIAALHQRGHDVVTAIPGRCFDLETGEGLTSLLSGAGVVVDVSSPPMIGTEAAVQRVASHTRVLLEHEAQARVAHHVALTPVGTTECTDGPWFRAALAKEQLIRHSTVPYSIVRTAPSFESLQDVADTATVGAFVRVPSVLVQPVASDDVVRLLASMAGAAPLDGAIEIGGPEPHYLDALLERVLGARQDPRKVVVDPSAPYFGARLESRTLVAGDEAELGTVRFDEWLRATFTRPSSAATATTVGSDREYTFRVSDVPPGSVLLRGDIAIFSVAGGLCATQAMCTHKAGPLSEGAFDDGTVACPLHGARFDIWTGAVLRGPARLPLRTYPVVVDGDVGHVITDARPARALATPEESLP